MYKYANKNMFKHNSKNQKYFENMLKNVRNRVFTPSRIGVLPDRRRSEKNNFRNMFCSRKNILTIIKQTTLKQLFFAGMGGDIEII